MTNKPLARPGWLAGWPSSRPRTVVSRCSDNRLSEKLGLRSTFSRDSDASHDYISSARIVSPDPVPSRTRHSSASLIILLIDQEERESLVFDLHAKGIIIVYLIESDLSLAFYDPITRGYRWREPRETRGLAEVARGIEDRGAKSRNRSWAAHMVCGHERLDSDSASRTRALRA